MRRLWLRPVLLIVVIAFLASTQVSLLPRAAQGQSGSPDLSSPGSTPANTPAFSEPAVPLSPAPPGTVFKFFTGADFRPRHSSSGYEIFAEELWATTAPALGSSDFVVRPDLPQGAQINAVTFYFIDNSAADTMHFWLVRYHPADDTSADLVHLDTLAGSPSPSVRNVFYTSLTGIDTVDNLNYTYQLQVRFTGSLGQSSKLVGAQIAYTVPTVFLPALVR